MVCHAVVAAPIAAGAVVGREAEARIMPASIPPEARAAPNATAVARVVMGRFIDGYPPMYRCKVAGLTPGVIRILGVTNRSDHVSVD